MGNHKTQKKKKKTQRKTQRKSRGNKGSPQGRILLTHQLFPNVPEPAEHVVVADHMWLTDEKPFNKLTLFHRFVSASEYAKEHGYHRCWIGDYKRGPFSAACRWLQKQGISEVCMYDPVDIPLVKSVRRICKKHKLNLTIQDTPAFSETHDNLDAYLKEHPPTTRKTPDGKRTIRGYNHSTFYKWNRTRLELLMNKDGKKPLGGKWSFDTENREPFPKSLKKDPTELVQSSASSAGLSSQVVSTEVPRILKLIASRYSSNPGMLDPDDATGTIGRAAQYPLTRKSALKRLRTFFKKMLPKFGTYEDAFRHKDIPYGYHSVLSSSLNNGLLTPDDVIGAIKEVSGKRARKYLASLEGFTRQVIGWRAYTRMVYREERDVILKSNYLGHKRRLDKQWFRGEAPPSTGISWLDDMFCDATNRAYAHHIVRLMVFSQWFLLMRIKPLDVMDWFWSVVSIDAYEWVMVPNVLGMGQFADGGMMMSRPYISASAYLKKMSGGTLPKDDIQPQQNDDEISWDDTWDALYYSFLMDHQKQLGKVYAYSRSYAYLKKASSEKRKEWKKLAKMITKMNT